MVDRSASTGGAVLVSGGSRGLGLAVVDYLLRDRHMTVAAFARSDTAETRKLQDEFPGRFVFTELDARLEPCVVSFVRQASLTFGGIIGLVNNAAIGQDHLLANMPIDLIGELIDANIRAPILLTRQVIREMLVGRTGSVVNVTSICATRGFPGLAVYSATKGAMEAFTRSLARELGPRGIRVNAVAPGFFDSEMSSVLGPRQMAAIRRRTPLGALVNAKDVVPTIARLLLDESQVTGQVVCVDGGASV